MNIVQQILQCVYPTLCRECNALITPSDIFCGHCLANIRPIPSKIFPITKNLTLTVFAVSHYASPVRRLVIKKFSGDVLASRQLARMMLAFTPVRTMPIDYFVPIPLHWTRYASRGFNQAHVIAKSLSKELKKPTLRLLHRSRRTTFQWKLSAERRRTNVQHAFSIHPWYKFIGTDCIQGKNIVLIDDLCTTGATLIQVAKVIARYEPASLTALVGCRAI
jgi:ComF family protein